jgi:hypothetical protein
MAQMVLTLYLAQLFLLVAVAVLAIHPKRVAMEDQVVVDKALLEAQEHLVRVTMAVLVKMEVRVVEAVALLRLAVLAQ